MPPRSPFLTLGDELGLEGWGGLEWLRVSTKGGWGAAQGLGVGEGWWNRQEASPCVEPEVSTLGVTPFLL